MNLQQQPLYRDRRHAGFWATVRIGKTVEIDDAAWTKAMSGGELVGTCRQCGGYLRPEPPYKQGPVRWYPAKCETCKYETAAHGPRPQPKTAQKTWSK